MKTIVNKNTGKVLYATIFEFVDTDNEIAIDELLTENFVKPYFNFETREFYENATAEEIVEATKTIVPNSVTKRQLKQALVLANIDLQNIDLAIEQIEDETERLLMQIYWQDSNDFERYHPKLIEFASQLQISEAQADQLFILASTL